MKFIVYDKLEDVTTVLPSRRKNFELFTEIECIAGVYAAMEATSWAEDAGAGEVYDEDLFTITVEE